MDLLLDTNILVWAGIADRRLSPAVRDLLQSDEQAFFVSAVTAWEFVELERRGRLPAPLTFLQAIEGLAIELLDFPAAAWPVAATLPPIHKDPIDRMLIGHAIVAKLTLLTSDTQMRAYPVQTFW